jgi:hypothetical protein
VLGAVGRGGEFEIQWQWKGREGLRESNVGRTIQWERIVAQ